MDEKESCDGKSFLIDGSALVLSSSVCVHGHIIVLGIHRDTQQMEQQFKSKHKPHFIPLCVFYSPAKITTRVTITIIVVLQPTIHLSQAHSLILHPGHVLKLFAGNTESLSWWWWCGSGRDIPASLECGTGDI